MAALLWLLALATFALAVVRWADLRGLTRWNVFILVASYVFYGAYDWHFVVLLAGRSSVGCAVSVGATTGFAAGGANIVPLGSALVETGTDLGSNSAGFL